MTSVKISAEGGGGGNCVNVSNTEIVSLYTCGHSTQTSHFSTIILQEIENWTSQKYRDKLIFKNNSVTQVYDGLAGRIKC